jgi:hypothetical protein
MHYIPQRLASGVKEATRPARNKCGATFSRGSS